MAVLNWSLGPRTANELCLDAMVFFRGVPLGRYRARNLSAKGAVLTGGYPIPEDEQVRILLGLPQRKTEPIALHGRVELVRQAGPDHVAVVVNFENITMQHEDMIHDAVLAALDRPDPPELRRRG